MKNKGYTMVILFSTVLLITSCKSEYQQLVDQEVAKGVVADSLIFGMRLGQTKKDFFQICWDLNKQELISQGTGNTTARYTEKFDSTRTDYLTKDLLFYGIFDEDKVMRGMDMTYSYNSWALWNEKTHSPYLLKFLQSQIMKDYGGNPFIEIPLEELNKTALVKIDGIRQILMYPKNNKDVVVKIEDLRYKYKL